MKKFLKDKCLSCVLTLGLIGSMSGVALAALCDQVIIGPGVRCTLYLEIDDENGTPIECDYDCIITPLED